ncbi:hypothetical protein ACWGOE_07300 [Leucobacter chromiiresistens]
MTVHVITGPPCAGKTTFARAQGGNVIDLDDIEEELGGERYAEHSPVRSAAVQVRRERIAAALAADEETWVIHTAPSAEQLGEYLAAGATVQRIDPGREVVLERAQQRPQHTVQLIEEWYAKHPQTPAHSGGDHAAPAADNVSSSGETGTTITQRRTHMGTQQGGTGNDGAGGENGGGESFKPITSQEQLDRVIGDRISRVRRDYDGFEDYKAKAEKFDAAEQANKTAEQKAADELAKLQRENESLKVSQLRSSVASTKGVPESLLKGSTQEELEAHADELLAFRGVDEQKQQKQQRLIVEGENGSATHEGKNGLRAVASQLFGSKN